MHNLFKPSGLKIAIFFILLTGVVYFLEPSFLSTLELEMLDLRFVSRGPAPAGKEVALVTVDEKSLDELGRWPWSRVRIAELLDALSKYDAKAVGFDIVWAEPDENSELKALTGLKGKLKEINLKNPTLENYVTAALKKADTDRLLADAVSRSRRVILGYFFHFTGNENQKNQENLLLSSYNRVKFTSPEARQAPFFEAKSAEVNIPVISEAAEGAGYFNVFPDRDGTVRWMPLVIKYKDRFYCSLSLAVLQKFLDNLPLSLKVAEFGVEEIRLGDVPIPISEEGRLLINYRGPQKTFPHYSATDVIHGRIPPQAFKDKIVLVGATAMGIYDIRVTPFDHVYPGLEIHANVIDSILQQDFLHRPNWVTIYDLLAVLIIGLILGIALPRLKALWGALLAGILFVAFGLVANYLFRGPGIWVNMTFPLLNLVITYLGITGYQYMSEEREKKKVRTAFQHYLTASIVEQMLKHPDKLKLGGEKKDLTVLFSDIRGFTSISEQLSPEMLVKFLNQYLTRMTDIVFKYEGTLDKYMGDAIMAIWGAPLDQPDHTLKACQTALDMLAELRVLQEKWAAEKLPLLRIGVGINAGPMVVGNMGSDRRFDYTAMGDSVNLGSRLEGLNKIYGTHILVSAATYERVQDVMLGRELDSVRVKGKDQPVKIYELIARRSDASPEQKALADEFHAALKAFQERNWEGALAAFEALLGKVPDDGPARLYVTRCQEMINHPPPPDWDGVCTMTTK